MQMLFLENNPPVAGDDQFYTGLGQTVTLDVLDNDDDPDWDDLFITSVTQPANGSVTFSPFSVTYTPDPGFGSGSDTFQYTVSDDNGGSDTATVTVTMVEVTGFTVEWQQPDETWLVVPNGELSWSHDNLRWTVQYSPSAPPVASEVHWLMKPWAERDNPSVPWTAFGLTACDCPAEENPGAGEWAIKAEAHFNDEPNQTDFVVVLQEPEKKDIAEITSIEWVTHVKPDGTPSELAGQLTDDPEGSGKRFFPDAQDWTSPARNKVDLLITVNPARAGIPISMNPYDVDDPSDDDGPIDEDYPLQQAHFNNPDNFPTAGAGFSISHVNGETDANGQFRSVVTVGAIQPGNNWRFAASGRWWELDPVRAFGRDPLSQLWYEVEVDGFWDVNTEPILDETDVVNGIATSPVLTVWRKLHVEVDSMGAPPPGTAFPDDGIPIDVDPMGPLPAPDTSLLADAFRPAFIEVVIGTPYDNADVPFVYHVVDSTAADRGIGESAAYWAVYIIGAYEGPASLDGDQLPGQPLEAFRWGFTFTAGLEYSFIYHETLRDGHEDGAFPEWDGGVYARTHHERQLVVHEIGHHFGLGHPPAGQSVMSQAEPNVIPPDHFSEEELKAIREIEFP